MTKNWVCHSWKNRSWIDCHKFGSTLELYKCKEERILFRSTKQFSHIIYIYCHYIKLLLRFIVPIVWFDVQEKGVKNIQNRRKIYGFSMQHIMYEEKTHKCLPPLLSKDMSWANVASYITLFWNTVLDDSWNMIYLYFYGCYQTHLHAFKPLQF